jgi:hypothetical protein
MSIQSIRRGRSPEGLFSTSTARTIETSSEEILFKCQQIFLQFVFIFRFQNISITSSGENLEPTNGIDIFRVRIFSRISVPHQRSRNLQMKPFYGWNIEQTMHHGGMDGMIDPGSGSTGKQLTSSFLNRLSNRIFTASAASQHCCG